MPDFLHELLIKVIFPFTLQISLSFLYVAINFTILPFCLLIFVIQIIKAVFPILQIRKIRYISLFIEKFTDRILFFDLRFHLFFLLHVQLSLFI